MREEASQVARGAGALLGFALLCKNGEVSERERHKRKTDKLPNATLKLPQQTGKKKKKERRATSIQRNF
jgi:hypothetical protein